MVKRISFKKVSLKIIFQTFLSSYDAFPTPSFSNLTFNLPLFTLGIRTLFI
jgi:hypothetical protein